MKIAIIGNYGAQNVGDEMILEGLLKTIQDISPEAEVVVLSANPKETSEIHRVRSVPKFASGLRSFFKNSFGPKLTKKEIKSADYVIIGGGGLFGSVDFRANFIWGIQAFMASKCKKPVIMYGQSIGEVKNRFLQHLIQKVFQKAVFIGVRDENSKSELKKIGVSKKIHLMPDLAFKNEYEGKLAAVENKKILVCLRAFPNFPEEIKNSISRFLNWLIEEEKYQITFIDFQQGEEQGDKVLHHQILMKINDQSAVKHIFDFRITTAIIQEFASAGFVLAMRLHSVISAIKSNRPFIALNYHSKVRNLLSTLNLESTCLDLSEISFENLKEKFEWISSQKESLIKKLEAINSSAQKSHHEVEKSIKKILTWRQP